MTCAARLRPLCLLLVVVLRLLLLIMMIMMMLMIMPSSVSSLYARLRPCHAWLPADSAPPGRTVFFRTASRSTARWARVVRPCSRPRPTSARNRPTASTASTNAAAARRPCPAWTSSSTGASVPSFGFRFHPLLVFLRHSSCLPRLFFFFLPLFPLSSLPPLSICNVPRRFVLPALLLLLLLPLLLVLSLSLFVGAKVFLNMSRASSSCDRYYFSGATSDLASLPTDPRPAADAYPFSIKCYVGCTADDLESRSCTSTGSGVTDAYVHCFCGWFRGEVTILPFTRAYVRNSDCMVRSEGVAAQDDVVRGNTCTCAPRAFAGTSRRRQRASRLSSACTATWTPSWARTRSRRSARRRPTRPAPPPLGSTCAPPPPRRRPR
jgi:hypothetical protein